MNPQPDIYATEYHEDTSVIYDYIVQSLVNHNLLFSIPDDFVVTEIDLNNELSDCCSNYRSELNQRLTNKGIVLDIPILESHT